jgi:hypothetical protein
MLSRRKVEEPSVETVESLTTEIDALDEALTETGQARAGAQAELGETNELGRRAELREIIAKAEATIADGRARLDHLRCVRDRLAMERELAKLDPIREKIEEGEEGEPAPALVGRGSRVEHRRGEADFGGRRGGNPQSESSTLLGGPVGRGPPPGGRRPECRRRLPRASTGRAAFDPEAVGGVEQAPAR